MPALFDRVTEAQRECLRLTLTHHSSKEIAQIVGVSPSAVDKRLERAVQLLGASSRFAAARMLHEFERGSGPAGSAIEFAASPPSPPNLAGADVAVADATSDPITSEPIDVAADGAPPAKRPHGRPGGLALRVLGAAPTTRTAGGVRNELRKTERLLLIGALIFVVSVLTVALLNMGQTLSGMIVAMRASTFRH